MQKHASRGWLIDRGVMSLLFMFMVAGQLVLCAGMTISRPQCVGDSSVAGGRIGQIAGHYDNYARSVKRCQFELSDLACRIGHS
jgi:hypothetical protein